MSKKTNMRIVSCRLHESDVNFLDKELKLRNERANIYEQKTRADLIQFAILQYVEHLKKMKK